jgi:zinc and cadmium transporter
MIDFLTILGFAVINGLISVGGGALSFISSKKGKAFVPLLVPLLAGVLLATAFLDILPDLLPYIYTEAFVWFVATIAAIFLIELFMKKWEDDEKTNRRMVSYSLGITGVAHNIVFGILIAVFASYYTGGLGIAIFLGISDIPHELGVFGKLLQAGYSRKKALLLNTLWTLPTIIGAIIGYFYKVAAYNYIPISMAILAGWFFYIAVHDLFPDMEKQRQKVSFFWQAAMLIIGILLVAWVLRRYDTILSGYSSLYIPAPQ